MSTSSAEPANSVTVVLPKKFGLLNAISINMSNMVGTGPFITVPAILATMGGPQALVCWLVGAVIAIADGLVFATGTVGMALYTGFVFKGLVSRPWAMRLLAAGFALAAMVLLYRKIRDIARIVLVLWSGLLLTSIWVVVEGG